MFDFTSSPSPTLTGNTGKRAAPGRANGWGGPPTLACVLAPNLIIQVERGRFPNGPIIVLHPFNGENVLAASNDVVRAGVQLGMPLYEARKTMPLAQLVPANEDDYHARHAAMLQAVRAFAPAVETVALGEFLIDVRGLGRLHGGEVKLAEAIHKEATTASGLRLGVGVAGGKFTARQAARTAFQSGVQVIPAGDESKFLSGLPITALPNLPADVTQRLRLLDIHTLGQFVSYRKPAMLRQFGPQVSELYELARGNDRRPLNPDLPPLRVVRSKTLDEPVDDHRILSNLVMHLATRLSRTLQLRGYHAEAVKLSIEIGWAGPIRLERGQALKPPTADPQQLSRMTLHLLDQLGIAGPVSSVSVCAYPLRSWHLSAQQQALILSVVSEKRAQVEAVMQAIWQRFGEWALKFAAFIGSPLPVKVRVRVNDKGWPTLVGSLNHSYRVMGIDEEWQEERQWWAAPIRRHYYRVMLDDDSLRNIYLDLVSGEWYLDRGGFIL